MQNSYLHICVCMHIYVFVCVYTQNNCKERYTQIHTYTQRDVCLFSYTVLQNDAVPKKTFSFLFFINDQKSYAMFLVINTRAQEENTVSCTTSATKLYGTREIKLHYLGAS